MKKLLIALALVFLACPAFAGTESKLLGKWINQGAKGAMLVEFSANSISFTPVDAAGKPTDDPEIETVSYGGQDNLVSITIADGATFTASLQDPDIIVLTVPGLPPTQYKRVK